MRANQQQGALKKGAEKWHTEFWTSEEKWRKPRTTSGNVTKKNGPSLEPFPQQEIDFKGETQNVRISGGPILGPFPEQEIHFKGETQNVRIFGGHLFRNMKSILTRKKQMSGFWGATFSATGNRF